MRRVKETLTSYEAYGADEDPRIFPAVAALQSKRLSFTWLDGEAQKVSPIPWHIIKLLTRIFKNRVAVNLVGNPCFCVLI